jgi:hypothetical protein
MNQELLSLYEADKQERVNPPNGNTPAYKAMRDRDRKRRERVMEIADTNEIQTAEDYYHAAWIMNHGDTPEEARNAHILAFRSSELGHGPARWLTAATYDRWQMYQGKPQKFGTNYVYDGRQDRLWDVDPKTTDEERAAWDVPPLAEQLRKAEEANRQQRPLSKKQQKEFEANAPEWLKEAIKNWRAAESNSDNHSLS